MSFPKYAIVRYVAAEGTGELRLTVSDYRDPTRWHWALSESGEFLADHDVRLDGATWQYEAFTDLLGYLSWHVAPDRRAQQEAEIVAELGAWIGAKVLGPVADALVGKAPAAVRVIVPDEARVLAFRPLELAYAGRRPARCAGRHPGHRPGNGLRPGSPRRATGCASSACSARPTAASRSTSAANDTAWSGSSTG